ncbi:50S ribosomal protein L13 [Microaceticoccus formicicus]|uniref:50S ribosomal protein L13 n=1 Tax=Microaceticoccus formicicus TaxID=3118105 RepID=UPI003CCFFABA|nr:50S ribosomal protein L13 [Peptoniphilaceae bacterium AMB_02]
MKSYVARPKDIERKWYVIDATDKVLGRLATEVATLLRGKHKPIYTPTIDTGDYVIVINADKIRLTGNKLQQKEYVYHTGYPGGRRAIRYDKLLQSKPEKAIELAVKGMLPHTKLGRAMYRKLRVYAGDTHQHEAQMPEVHEF